MCLLTVALETKGGLRILTVSVDGVIRTEVGITRVGAAVFAESPVEMVDLRHALLCQIVSEQSLFAVEKSREEKKSAVRRPIEWSDFSIFDIQPITLIGERIPEKWDAPSTFKA